MIILPRRYIDHVDGPPLNDNHDNGGYHQDDCSICRRPFTMAGYFTLGCSHIFHISCIVWSMLFSRRCPSCRLDIDDSVYASFGLERFVP